eukprot:TRINITY_DN3857_c0_g2_i1.p2 TRINITY_DN3857_c0_g2~~TRINITY_DN3857_c0_g2_i1.p2  ORF type:complete len:353 (-),score=123.79 TRINITY_DN3857_c0_g2_i1:438-1496(-)
MDSHVNGREEQQDMATVVTNVALSTLLSKPDEETNLSDLLMKPSFLRKNYESIFLGVYDGHGGSSVSSELKNKFYSVFSEEIRKCGIVSEDIFREAFVNTHERLNEGFSQPMEGSTAVSCLVSRSNETGSIFCANAGDSLAIVIKEGGEIRLLSEDHQPRSTISPNNGEVSRVRDAGGVIYRKRVQGILAVTRAFGDKSLSPLVISTPYVDSIHFKRSGGGDGAGGASGSGSDGDGGAGDGDTGTGGGDGGASDDAGAGDGAGRSTGDDFGGSDCGSGGDCCGGGGNCDGSDREGGWKWLILASDGLFGALSFTEISQISKIFDNPQALAEKLVQESMKKNKDNITVLIVEL